MTKATVNGKMYEDRIINMPIGHFLVKCISEDDQSGPLSPAAEKMLRIYQTDNFRVDMVVSDPATGESVSFDAVKIADSFIKGFMQQVEWEVEKRMEQMYSDDPVQEKMYELRQVIDEAVARIRDLPRQAKAQP